MARVVHRITAKTNGSAKTGLYPLSEYIHNPENWNDIISWPQKYRKITGDLVSLMSQAERDAVEAAQIAQRLADEKASETSKADRRDYRGLFYLISLASGGALTPGQVATQFKNFIAND